ncbi:MAG TPA: 6-phosphofructo-2-kinase/fructose-2,6-bisphosphatase [Myxococcota bacterium]|nr:6-phosphofructo-2-kinase/fructose-2,6-bisphosphatase [Myxococcota bacterium]
MTVRPVDLDPVVLVMVGMPARGKSYTARKVARYLLWLGYRARVFNVGSYRRTQIGAGQDHSFFDPANPEGLAARRELAAVALADLLAWIRDGGEVGIYDATNHTQARREWVRGECEAAGVRVVFLELQCEDPSIIEGNIRETKVTSPDYAGRDPEDAARDFRARIDHYALNYEPVDDPDLSFIRIIDVGRQVVVNRVGGYLPGRLVTFLMNLHISRRPVYLSRHGESLYNLDGRIGGDSPLSEDGRRYALSLAEHMRAEVPLEQPLVVWTSTLRRTVETASVLVRPTRQWRVLDEIDAGICDGMTYPQIARTLPQEFVARKADKFRYRYPRGESYEDVIARLEPAIIEIERQRAPVLVIAHQAVLRALFAYFTEVAPEACPHLSVPLHTVIRLVPGAYGCAETRAPLPPSPDAPSPPED